MASIYDWSTTPSNNASADGSMTWAEGQAPSTVNNSARQLCARVAELLGDMGGALTAGGTANGITVTANSSFTTYADGRMVAFKAAADNTGATTLNVNSVGAKPIRKIGPGGDTALAAGDIQEDGIYVCRYNESLDGGSGGWQIINSPGVSTSADNTWTGQQVFDADTGFGTAIPRSPVHVETSIYNANTPGGVHLTTNTGIAAEGRKGAAITFGRADGGSNRAKAAVGSVQTGSDANENGVAFYGNNNAATANDDLVELARLDHDGFFRLNANGAAPNDYVGIRVTEAGNNALTFHISREYTGSSTPTDLVSIDGTSGNATFTGTISGNGSGLTALNASNISSGTLAVGRLDSTVWRDGNTPTGTQITNLLSGGTGISASSGTIAVTGDVWRDGNTPSWSQIAALTPHGSGTLALFNGSSEPLRVGRTDGTVILFRNTSDNSTAGSIVTTNAGTQTSYNTSSDYRLPWKEGWTDLNGSGTFIDALRPRYFPKAGKAGFLAHEFAEVSPSSVVGEKDAVDEDGSPIYQQMQPGTDEVVANIVAELQDIRRRLAKLEHTE